METITGIKATVAAVIGCLTAVWGWFGWFCLLLAFCMGLDYLTGTWAAKRAGEWSSKVARDGRWHKVAILVAVIVACLLDLVIGIVLERVPGVALPFDYSVLFGPLVVAWYSLTELGSILENCGKLGAPQPAWFKKAVAALQGAADEVGESLSADHDENEK